MVKHLCIIALNNHYQIKPKPYFYLDTHAGEGEYEFLQTKQSDECLALAMLDKSKSDTNIETRNIVKQYCDVVAKSLKYNKSPGSPCFLDSLSRKQDKIWVNELHPTAYQTLRQFAKNTELEVHNRDAYEIIGAVAPPKPNRGVIFIDPPYEQAQEYKYVDKAIKSCLKKWPQACIAFWYPLLSPQRISHKTNTVERHPKSGLSESLLEQLSQNLCSPILDIKFTPHSASTSIGMYGSGVAIINPPYQFETSLGEISETLNDYFGSGEVVCEFKCLVERS